MDTTRLVRAAEKGIDGRHPQHGFAVQDGNRQAIPYTLLALVSEQQRTNAALDRIADSLDRIANATEKHEPAVAEPEPKRRVWLPGRRHS